jgi:hypothetical protein
MLIYGVVVEEVLLRGLLHMVVVVDMLVEQLSLLLELM